MLDGLTDRYRFLDRDGNPLDLDRTTAVDQYGNEHRQGRNDLTSVVVISAERGKETRRCVESILQHTTQPFEVIVSDVGSSSETLDTITALEDAQPNIHVIYNEHSTGTTGQRNQGVFFSRGEYLVFMDNDVIVLPGWLERLQKTMAQDEGIGLVGAKLLKTEIEEVYYCGCHAVTLEKEGKVYGIGLNKSGPLANLGRNDPVVMKGGEAPWYPTTCLLARRKVFFEVGGFDDLIAGRGIFIANEDKDLSLAVRKAGYKIYYCPAAEAIHAHDYAGADRQDDYHSKYRLRMEQIEKDTAYFVRKWAITFLIEKLPHEDNTKQWDGQRLTPVDLRLDAGELSHDLVGLC
ncbi:MAG: glycosyltransferase family 2 protein [Deltaproteobacteria bacterium]|nr:glycosyltransferase family 2 protein [Deltaproteobacteria bacterium]